MERTDQHSLQKYRALVEMLEANREQLVGAVVKLEYNRSIQDCFRRMEAALTRHQCNEATRGSQRWLQYFVNHSPEALDAAIGLGRLEWLSPLASDDYSEYSDVQFLERLGIKSLPIRGLDDFWPRRGPVWDGLARTSAGESVIVEAKAHVSEMFKSCAAESSASIATIHAALDETRRFVGADSRHDWAIGFYQYANRLAHAYLLNELNGLPTYLVFIDFFGDADVGGPSTANEWATAVRVLHEALGITGRIPSYVRHATVDVGSVSA